MIDHRKVRQTLREHLLTVSGVTAAMLAYEDRTFTPPNPPSIWIDETYLPVTERLVANDTVQLTAMVRFEVRYPQGRGTEAPEDLAKLIADAFKPAQTLNTQSTPVQLYRVERQPGVQVDETWWAIPVYVHFFVYTQNS